MIETVGLSISLGLLSITLAILSVSAALWKIANELRYRREDREMERVRQVRR